MFLQAPIFSCVSSVLSGSTPLPAPPGKKAGGQLPPCPSRSGTTAHVLGPNANKPRYLSTLSPYPTRKAMPDLQLWRVKKVIKNGFAQSRTALFRAFSSHRQPSASLTKLFPSFLFFFFVDFWICVEFVKW